MKECRNIRPPRFSHNAQIVLRQRYLARNARGVIVESPAKMLWRVATDIALAERRYLPDAGRRKLARQFYEVMSALVFLPNSPTLMNAGRALQQLSACFVLPINDSLESIFDAVKQQALIHQSGGGTGFSFSRLRPQADRVVTTSDWHRDRCLSCASSTCPPTSSSKEEPDAAPIWAFCASTIRTFSNHNLAEIERWAMEAMQTVRDNLSHLRPIRLEPVYVAARVIDALTEAGLGPVRITMQRAPAWTTDWISDDGRRKLREYGIAPPGPVEPGQSVPIRLVGRRAATSVPCPRCGSTNTERLSAFGATACKALYRCRDCREPFEHFKPI